MTCDVKYTLSTALFGAIILSGKINTRGRSRSRLSRSHTESCPSIGRIRKDLRADAWWLVRFKRDSYLACRPSVRRHYTVCRRCRPYCHRCHLGENGRQKLRSPACSTFRSCQVQGCSRLSRRLLCISSKQHAVTVAPFKESVRLVVPVILFFACCVHVDFTLVSCWFR